VAILEHPQREIRRWAVDRLSMDPFVVFSFFVVSVNHHEAPELSRIEVVYIATAEVV
jgi:hypothetical protein